jgi:hypothetical protein
MREGKSFYGAKGRECGPREREAQFRGLRIERLRQRIEQGTFRVNPLEIAAAMLVEEDEAEFGELVLRDEPAREHGKRVAPFVH